MIPSWLKKEKSAPEPAQQESAPPRQYTDEELSAMERAPPGADRWGFGTGNDLWTRWYNLRWKARVAEAKRKVSEYKQADEAARVEARNYVPNVRVEKFVAGEFLIADEHEIPRRFIQAVEVDSIGREPYLDSGFTGFGSYVEAVDARAAAIAITLASGKVYRLTCCRHVVDAMFEAITNAWKHGEAE